MHKPSGRKYQFLLLLAFIAILVVSLSCNFGSSRVDEANPTVQALERSVALTSTAAASDTDDTSNDLATAEAEATQRSLTIGATQTANASGRDEGTLATATVAAPILAELPFYDVDPDNGQVGFMHDPVTIEVEGYQQFDFANDHMEVIARDFVMAADITWDTQYGSSACGFMLRSDGNQTHPNQYMVAASRIGQGHVFFSSLADGEMANVKDFYASTEDPKFEWQNGTTNRLAVVGRGNILEIYTNQTKIGEVDTTVPPKLPSYPSRPQQPANSEDLQAMENYRKQLQDYQDLIDQVDSNYQTAVFNFETKEAIFDQGFVGMLALSESGRTVCHFENTWLWLIEE
jgi:hypothetical protein